MPSEFPPQLSKRTKVALAVAAVVTLLYSIVVAAQILLWLLAVGVAIGLYLTYLLIVAIFRLAEAVERIATAAEVDSGIRDVADVAPRTDGRTVGDSRPEDRGSADANGGDSPGDDGTDHHTDAGETDERTATDADGTDDAIGSDTPGDPAADAADVTEATPSEDPDGTDPESESDPDDSPNRT